MYSYDPAVFSDLDTFLQKKRIEKSSFIESQCKWEDLLAIRDDYLQKRDQLEAAHIELYDALQQLEGVHSFARRIKSPDSLIAKIISKNVKRVQKKGKAITLENYRTEVTDLIGFRALHRYKKECLCLHDQIMGLFKSQQHETPVVNLRTGDDKVLFGDMQNATIKEDRNYRSIHYVFSYKELCKWELQTRTLFEEGWSEPDHTLMYKGFSNDTILSQYSDTLSRLTGVCDEIIKYMKERYDYLLNHQGKTTAPLGENASEDQQTSYMKNQLNEFFGELGSKKG